MLYGKKIFSVFLRFTLNCTYRWSTMAPFHLPHNINHAWASVKMAATSVTQRSCFLSSAKKRLPHHKQQIRLDGSQHSVSTHLQCRSLGGWRQNQTLLMGRCQLPWQHPLEWQVSLEPLDSLFSGLSLRYTCSTLKIWNLKQAVQISFEQALSGGGGGGRKRFGGNEASALLLPPKREHARRLLFSRKLTIRKKNAFCMWGENSWLIIQGLVIPDIFLF